MRVATLFCEPCPEVIVRAMVASVRKHMDCEIVQLTDLTTPKLDCVDSVRRLEGTIVSSVLARHLADLEGETLYLDYDTIVREDVSYVFEQDFDLAITTRSGREKDANTLFQVCPHNVGVMFSRSPEFWKYVANRYDGREDEPSWFKFQIVVTEAINVLKQFKILELPSEKYNYTPKTLDEDYAGRSILHFKGNKKAWMVAPKDVEKALLGNKMVTKLFKTQKGELFITPDHPRYSELINPEKKQDGGLNTPL